MATVAERGVRVTWVVAASTQNRSDWEDYPSRMKDVAPIWGSWKTWINFGTDNVICHDREQAQRLQSRAFHAVCNLYLLRSVYEDLGSPRAINAYDGEWSRPCADIEDIVAMHLASHQSDLVLMLGFDFGKISQNHPGDVDRKGMMRSAIQQSSAQWVAIDHDIDPDPAFANLTNFTRDTMSNVLRLLSK